MIENFFNKKISRLDFIKLLGSAIISFSILGIFKTKKAYSKIKNKFKIKYIKFLSKTDLYKKNNLAG